eukprot:c20620_g1_i1.p1 GENE.c20620_g1_i1~~c20620_g1_i1.p1  ORF type:complete len:223 (-),score=63.87 c20620_g1_i1:48-716(-)
MGNNPSQPQNDTPRKNNLVPQKITSSATPLLPSQPVAIHGTASAEHIDYWEEDDNHGTGDKSPQIQLSQSAPVHSNRIGKPIPMKPRIKPQSINVPELPDIELPPSYTDSAFSHPSLSGSAQMSKSMPVSRSLQQYAMSCPPNIQSILQVQIKGSNDQTITQSNKSQSDNNNNNSVLSRSRKDSILDLLVTGTLIMEGNQKSEPTNSMDIDGADSDEELPFK